MNARATLTLPLRLSIPAFIINMLVIAPIQAPAKIYIEIQPHIKISLLLYKRILL
jgi:hypothetical protein